MVRLRPGVGVGVIIRNNGMLLLQKRVGAHGAGTWGLPGGHIEFGESPVDAAVRESKEEADVDIVNVRIVGVTNDVMRDEGKHYFTFFVESELAGGNVKINDSSVSEFGWFSPDNLPSPLFLPLKNFLENRRLL